MGIRMMAVALGIAGVLSGSVFGVTVSAAPTAENTVQEPLQTECICAADWVQDQLTMQDRLCVADQAQDRNRLRIQHCLDASSCTQDQLRTQDRLHSCDGIQSQLKTQKQLRTQDQICLGR